MVYWDELAAVVGETPTLGLVIVLAVGAGAWFARTAEFGFGGLAAGTLLGYGVGMLAIELWVAPESPVHLLWYGAIAAAVLCGAGLWRLAVRRSRQSRPAHGVEE
jgi:integral membrane sensor domain MASE1